MRKAEQGGQGHPPPHQQWQLQGWTPRGTVCKVLSPLLLGAGRGGGEGRHPWPKWSAAAAHLVIRRHQVLDHLAVCCGDLLDVGGFLLSWPSQL